MTIDLKSSIKNSLKKQDEVSISNIDTKDDIPLNETGSIKFNISKKRDDKTEKISFPLYMNKTKQKEIDKVVKKTGYSRNELINMMIDFCLENLEFTE